MKNQSVAYIACLVSIVLLSCVVAAFPAAPRLRRNAEDGSLSPPHRPESFKNAEELYDFLEKLREYYDLMSRPRFGRSVDSQRRSYKQRKLSLGDLLQSR